MARRKIVYFHVEQEQLRWSTTRSIPVLHRYNFLRFLRDSNIVYDQFDASRGKKKEKKIVYFHEKTNNYVDLRAILFSLAVVAISNWSMNIFLNFLVGCTIIYN